MAQQVKTQIFDRISYKGKNWVFSVRDFTKDFKRWEIARVFHILEKEGKIKRVLTGLYYYPEYSNLLHEVVAPDVHLAAKALARKYAWTIYPDGDTVLNYLGLSTQLVARAVYFSDGPTKKYKIGGGSLEFKHRAIAEGRMKLESSMLVVQAMKAIGEKQITEDFLKALSTKYKATEWQKIRRDTCNVADWVRGYIIRIADRLNGGK